MAIVYEHLRNDTNEVFYVGIGKTPRRAFSKHGRTRYWKKLVNKYSYTVNIRVNDATYDEAIEIEKYLIAFYGRKDLGRGPLLNMTDGGEGSVGYIHSNEIRQKMSETHKNVPLSDEHKKKMSLSQRNKKGVKGYCFNKKLSKYRARIKVGGKNIHLGLYNTPNEATQAYKEAKLKYHI